MLAADLPVGTLIGKYRITGRLGKGGMGIVYAGEDTRLRRPVAIKLLVESDSREDELLKRFLLEARAAACLNHPNVVTIHDVGQRGTVFYIVMELMSGGSAQSRITNQGPIPWPEATRIVADICRGLGAAHAAGLIHRDVKPANMLLATDGTAKLADFGLIKAPTLMRGNLTVPGTLVGTPQYMSPEHCAGEQLDERTDVYALGTAYYALLVGHAPYDGSDKALILYSHCSAPVPDPRTTNPEIPTECSRIIARAMAKTRAERFSKADHMLRELLNLATLGALPVARALSEPPPLQATAPPADQGATASGKRRLHIGVITALVAAAVIFLLVIASGLFRSGNSSTPEPDTANANGQNPVASGTPIVLRPRGTPWLGHKGEVKAIGVAAGRVASAGADGTVRVWALSTGALLHTLQHSAPLEAVALGPNGIWIAAGGPTKTVVLWDARSGEELGTVPGAQVNINALAFAPGGKQLAIASQNDLLLYDVELPAKMSRPVRLLEKQYVVAAVCFSANGKRLASCTNAGIVHLWDLPSLKHVTVPGTFDGRLTAVALSPDGRRLAFGTHQGVVHLWEADKGGAPMLWSNKEGRVTSLAFVPGRDTLIHAGAWAGPLRVCDVAAATTKSVPTGVSGVVNGFAFAPDGTALAAACSDGTVRLWDIMEGSK